VTTATRPAPCQYARTLTLRDGTAVNIRQMTSADADRIVAFARALPEADRLFLRADITDPAVVRQYQKGAIATFEHLGFQHEVLLQDFAIDRAGRTHDRTVMSHDVEGLSDRLG